MGLLAGLLIFVGFFIEKGEKADLSWYLMMALFYFSSTNYFPIISKNLFIDAYISVIGSGIVAYFLGPILFQIVGGKILLGLLVISPLFVISFVSDLKEWKEYKKNNPGKEK